MIRSWWRNANLFVRLAWGIALVFVLLHLLYSVRHARDQLLSNAEVFAITSMDRARAMAEVAGSDPALLQRLATPTFAVELLDTEPLPPPTNDSHSAEVEAQARELLRRSEPPVVFQSLWIERHKVRDDAGQTHRFRTDPRLVIVLPYQSRWLKVTTDMRSANWRNPSAGAIGTTFLALLLFAAVLWGMRRVTRFLPRFADAAESLGRGLSSEPLALQGPAEVRRVAAAFNEMQRRVTDHVSERTTMLAAFSHDLRTLATRLHLRLEALPEGEQRSKAAADLDAMIRILDEALAFARDDTNSEPFRALDLVSLLRTLLDEAADGAQLAGTDKVTQLFAEASLTLQAQPMALTRALANLIDNALKYGGSAVLTVQPCTMAATGVPGARIDIKDQGPGIPAADRERVLRPYVRLEQSRNRDTGGTGLGLAIVNNVVRRHGGTLTFLEAGDHAKDGGTLPTAADSAGFTVRVELPLRSQRGLSD